MLPAPWPARSPSSIPCSSSPSIGPPNRSTRLSPPPDGYRPHSATCSPDRAASLLTSGDPCHTINETMFHLKKQINKTKKQSHGRYWRCPVGSGWLPLSWPAAALASPVRHEQRIPTMLIKNLAEKMA